MLRSIYFFCVLHEVNINFFLFEGIEILKLFLSRFFNGF